MADDKNVLPGMVKFPEIVDGKIDIIQFMEASSYLVVLIGEYSYSHDKHEHLKNICDCFCLVRRERLIIIT